MSESIADGLLRTVFDGHFKALREELGGLPAEARCDAYKRLKPLIPVLRRVCRFRNATHPVGYAELREAVLADPAGFLAEQADRLAPTGALVSGSGFLDFGRVGGFFLRVQALQVGLASKSAITTGFSRGDSYPLGWEEHWFLRLGQILLDRPEDWVAEALGTVFDLLDRGGDWSMQQDGAGLMREALQRHPEWSGALAPYFGKAMRAGGFQVGKLRRYSAEMILAGLEHQPPDTPSWQEPLLLPGIDKQLLQLVANGQLPRAELIELTLGKLVQPLRPDLARAWAGFLGELQPTDDEYLGHGDVFVDMLNAPSNPAARLAAEVVRTRLLDDPARTVELAATLSYVLQHQTQAIAQGALRLYKALLKTHPDARRDILAQSMAGLGSPHHKLRTDLIRWLARCKPADFDDGALTELAALAETLPPSEVEPLRTLLPALPEAGAVSGDSPGAVDLADRVATLGQQVSASDPLSQQRLASLLKYLATGSVELEPWSWSPATIADGDAFELHATPESLAADLAHTHQRVFTEEDYDRLMASLLRLPEPDQAARRQLEPRLRELERLPPVDQEMPVNTPRPGPLLLASLWLTREMHVPAQHAPMLGAMLNGRLLRRLHHLRQLLVAGHDQLLATPTHAAGWLDPERFASRLAGFPRGLVDNQDLGDALYRLAPLPASRERAWTMLAPLMDDLDRDRALALTLALAPAVQAEGALSKLVARIVQDPPARLLLHNDLNLLGSLTAGLAALTGGKARGHDPASERLALLAAALHCRYGLAAGEAVQRHIPAPGKLAGGGGLKRVFRRDGDTHDLAARLLLDPQVVTPALLGRLFGKSRVFVGPVTDHPCLLPYVLAHPSSYLLDPHQAAVLGYQYPRLAQRFFEAGVCRVQSGEDYFRELAFALLETGQRPQVAVGARLGELAGRLVATPKPQQRERYVALFLGWLEDGRVTPGQLADALAASFVDAGKGLSYLDRALESLAMGHRAGLFTVIAALERILAGGAITGFAPKKLSTLLDRLLASLQESGQTVHHGGARATLDALAGARKSSVARSKAQSLLAQVGSADQPPPEVAAILALAEGGN